jgi:hypothetical protein
VRVALVVALIGVTWAASGCVRRDPFVSSDGELTSGDWRISTQVDRVTGRTLPSAGIVAPASNSYSDWPKPSMMQLTCFDGKPLVRFAFAWKIGSDANTILGYRFDDQPGRDLIDGVRFMQDERMVVIEDPPAVMRFIADIKGSQKLYVRIRSITHGRTTVDYDLAGSEPAIKAAFADCLVLTPVAPKKPAATLSKRNV